jgi:hypothetical protein
VVGAGEDDAAHPVEAGGLVHVVEAADVDVDGLAGEGGLGAPAGPPADGQVGDGVHAAGRLQHLLEVGDVGGDDLLAGLGVVDGADVEQAEVAAVAQVGAQGAADPAAGAGDEEPLARGRFVAHGRMLRHRTRAAGRETAVPARSGAGRSLAGTAGGTLPATLPRVAEHR